MNHIVEHLRERRVTRRMGIVDSFCCRTAEYHSEDSDVVCTHYNNGSFTCELLITQQTFFIISFCRVLGRTEPYNSDTKV